MPLKGYDPWRTASPPELTEVELPLCFLPEAALRRVLREALKSELEHNCIPQWCGDERTAEDLMRDLLGRAYETELVVLTPEEVEELEADRAEAAADWAYHHQD